MFTPAAGAATVGSQGGDCSTWTRSVCNSGIAYQDEIRQPEDAVAYNRAPNRQPRLPTDFTT
jgi:hypothetical protein